ncbi:MAG: endo-1,4-beta-xylanase [Candidatus Hydrogenedentes bacterium]|nr:endo-1,4-beta-xylanase [Candidatus Hydrogenedentota bacterium]
MKSLAGTPALRTAAFQPAMVCCGVQFHAGRSDVFQAAVEVSIFDGTLCAFLSVLARFSGLLFASRLGRDFSRGGKNPKPWVARFSALGNGISIGPWLTILVLSHLSARAAVTGTVAGEDGKPIPYTFVGALTSQMQLEKYAVTDPQGKFTLESVPRNGYLFVQPPAPEKGGLGIYPYTPRIYDIGDTANIAIRLPTAACLVLKAYDTNGRLLRWEDFMKNGHVGGQFLYATDLDDRMQPAAVWPVYDQLARDQGSPREKGLPALVVVPSGKPLAVQVLFWIVPEYGKLLLRADNGGKGFAASAPGAAVEIELNVELARTAVSDLLRRRPAFPEQASAEISTVESALREALAQNDPVACAAAADKVLALALKLRDQLELEAARAMIPRVRSGTLQVHVKDANGAGVTKCKVQITQRSRDFLFGVFEGSPYNAKAFETARKAGFELATVLMAWGWTDLKTGAATKDGIDKTLGLSALQQLGYKTKAHGVVWLQDYGILPDRARRLPESELKSAYAAHQVELLQSFKDKVSIWEAMNEPATTNAVGISRDGVTALLRDSSDAIKKTIQGRTLVNGPHEVDFGRKFLVYTLDNQPKAQFNLTYLDYLEQCRQSGTLKSVDVVGLQFYPGYRFNATFGGLQGPAMTPSWLVDTLERYARLGKPIHITEFSVPSTYDEDAIAGYWREPWTETTQADYAEAVFTPAFANPAVESITWWDVMDTKPSVITGGLIAKDGHPKPVFTRLQQLLKNWTTDTTAETDTSGSATITAFAGEYEVTATLPTGKKIKNTAHVTSGETCALLLETNSAR